MIQGHYIQGVFKEEIKNRFLCLVTVDDEDILCYIPSSCRLSNFINMPGRKVILTPVTSPASRTKYSVFAVKVGHRYIPVNLSGVNSVVLNQLHRRVFSALGKRKEVFREQNVNGYKSDLYVEDTKTIIEIKSILSFDTVACFPTVYSKRAIDQLKKISELLDGGYNVCYLFISLNSKVNTIRINSRIMEYCNVFRECICKGMKTYGYSVELHNSEVKIGKRIDVEIDNTSCDVS